MQINKDIINPNRGIVAVVGNELFICSTIDDLNWNYS